MGNVLTIGGNFGDYRVVRRLGKGGMGEVWLLESASGKQVAAKILDPESSADHESRKRFLREAELALGVKHPNLVETYDVGEDPETGLCYILMEYVSGGTLADYIKAHGALAIEDAVAVVEAIADVLELGRQKGIVHRDIKPANIMFDADGTPKLADLGIARAGGVGTDTTTVTQMGVMIGTPAYMSPEQMLDAHNVDTRADIYSLGVVFFEMLTGERPNKDDTIVQLMAKAVKGEPLPDVRTLRPEVSAALAQLLSMMVVPDKNGRISTPGQITNALAIIERGEEFVAASTNVSHTASSAGRAASMKPPKWIIPVLVLAALAVAFFIPALKKDRPATIPSQILVKEVVHTNVVAKTVVKTNVVEKKFIQTNAMEKIFVAPDSADKINTVDTHQQVQSSGPVKDRDWIQRKHEPKFSMLNQTNELSWIDSYKTGDNPIRICLDLSHGGFPSLEQAFYAKWMNAIPDFKQKACWHELETENLDSVNILVLPDSDAQHLYGERECIVIDRFLREGGTVVVKSSCWNNSWPMEKFLSRYGLELFHREGFSKLTREQKKNTREVNVACPALDGIEVKLPGLVYAAPHDEQGRDEWTSLIVDANDSYALMASRSVGRGHIVWIDSWHFFSDIGNLSEVWKRIFQASANIRKIQKNVPIGQRPATDAPFVLRVGPITIFTSQQWRPNAEKLARIVKDTLPTLERYCGRQLEPREMNTTKFVLTGTGIWGYLPQGDKTIVTGATFRGFPDRLVYLSTFVFRMMINGMLKFPYHMQFDNYIAMRSFCEMGYPNEMALAISEGRKKGDVDNRRFRFVDRKVVDQSGRAINDPNSVIEKAKFYSVYEEMRNIDPEFIPKLQKMSLSRSGKMTVVDLMSALNKMLSLDARALFLKYGIEIDGHGAADSREGHVSIVRNVDWGRLPPVTTLEESESRLKKTRIASMSFNSSNTLRDAISFLRKESGLNFYLRVGESGMPSMQAFKANDISAEEAVNLVCSRVNCKYELHHNVIIVFPNDTRDSVSDNHFKWSKRPQCLATQVLSNLRMPELLLDSNTSIVDLVNKLMATTRNDPNNGKLINWVVKTKTGSQVPLISAMALRNVSIMDALDLACQSCGMEFATEGKTVVVRPNTDKFDGDKENRDEGQDKSRFSKWQIKQMASSDGWRAMHKTINAMFPDWRLCDRLKKNLPKEVWTGRSAKRLKIGYRGFMPGVGDVMATYGTGDVLETSEMRKIRKGSTLHFKALASKGTKIRLRGVGSRRVPDMIVLTSGGSDMEEASVDLSEYSGCQMRLILSVEKPAFGFADASPEHVSWANLELKYH